MMNKELFVVVLLWLGSPFFMDREARAGWLELPLENPGAETGDTLGWSQSPPGVHQAVEGADEAWEGEWYFSLTSFDTGNTTFGQTIDLSAYRGRMESFEFGAYFDIENDRQTRIGYDADTDREYEYQCYILPSVLFYDGENTYLPGSGTPLPDDIPGWQYRSVNTLNWDEDQWESVRINADHAFLSIRFGYSFTYGMDQPYAHQIEEWRQWLGDPPVVRFDGAGARIDIDDYSWETEYVDCGRTFKNMTDRSLKVDGNGVSHMAYGSGHLYYARFDGTNVQKELVDPAFTTGQYAALALDSSNRPHIMYYDLANGNLKYASRIDDGQWHIETVTYVEKYGAGVSLAMDDGDNPHISYNYYDRAVPGGYLMYGWRDGGGWHFDTVSTELSFGDWYTSLALDANNAPHIAYCVDYGSEFKDMLKYATKDGSGWQTLIVVYVEGENFEQPSIALDGDGHPHISYADTTNFDLKYASWNGAEWQTQTLDSSGNVGWHSSLVFGKDGYPRISYYDGTNNKLMYLSRDGEGWHFFVVGDADDYRMVTALDLDQLGLPRIAYMDDRGNTLKHASWTGTAWQVTVIDQATYLGVNPSLALDSRGLPRISYLDRTTSTLKYAFRDSRGWHAEVVDSDAWAGCSALVVDPNDDSHLGYWSLLGYDLKYASADGFGWQIDSLAVEGDANMVCLDVDGAGIPHLLYKEHDDELAAETVFLKYGFDDGSGWIMESVDIIGNAASTFSLALDSENAPRISYKGIDDALFYGRRGAAGWEIETVDSEGRVGFDASIALDSSDSPHISYIDRSNSDLKYALRGISGWSTEVLPIAGYIGGNTAIGVDHLDQPHIVFYDDADGGSIRYISKSATGWHNELIDDAGFVGASSGISIDLDGDGKPHVSYYDDTCGCVKYAVRVPRGLKYDFDGDGDVDGEDLRAFSADASLVVSELDGFGDMYGMADP